MERQQRKERSTDRNELGGSGQSVIPVWVTRCPDLKGPVRDVLLNLAARRGPDSGSPWPSEKTIAGDLGTSERTVRRALGLLRAAGLIRVDVHGGPGGRVNRYHLEIDRGLPPGALAVMKAEEARRAERRRGWKPRAGSVGNDYGHRCPVSPVTGGRTRSSASEEAPPGAAVVSHRPLNGLRACACASAVAPAAVEPEPGTPSAPTQAQPQGAPTAPTDVSFDDTCGRRQAQPQGAPTAPTPDPAAEGGVPEQKTASGEDSQAPDRPEDDPDRPPPGGPRGGLPAPGSAPGAPAAAAAEASAPAVATGAPVGRRAEISAPPVLPAPGPGQALRALPPAPPASSGRPLDFRQDLVPYGPPGPLAAAALAAGLTPGEAAGEVMAGCPVKLAVAWLRAIARKRGRLRSPGAVFRAGCRSCGEPSLADLVDAERQLRGAAGELLPRGSLHAHRWAGELRRLAVGMSAAAAEVPEWMKRRAELEARAKAEREAAEKRLQRLLPTLAGEQRAQAEARLAQLWRAG